MQEDYYSQIDELQSDWSLGARNALQNYVDSTKNMFKSIGDMAGNVTKGIENAFVTMAQTGKLSFSDMANSIVADLVRIAVQKSITAPLASALSSWLGGGTPTTTPTTSSAFSGATYSAAGGFDIPSGLNPVTQLHEEEMVLPSEYANVIRDMASISLAQRVQSQGSSSGSSPNVTVNVQGVSSEPQVSATRDSNGGLNIDLIFNQLDKRMSTSIQSGQGQTGNAIKKRFGLTPQLG